MSDQKGRSPYKRKGKTPYVYGFKRCEHKSSHSEQHDGVGFVVCDACRVVLDNDYLKAERERAEQNVRDDAFEALQAA